MAGLYLMSKSPDYSTCKTAVTSFTIAVGKYVHKTNVRVTGLCPGFADTQMGQSVQNELPDIVNHIGDLMTPEYVAQGLLQVLADTDNSGEELVVSNRGLKYYCRKSASSKL